MDTPQATFDGWGICDVLGHQRYIGYITTQSFGAAVLFRVDIPALEPRTRVTKQPGYIDGRGYCPAGTTVEEGAVPGYTKLIGAGSIYTLTPTTQEAALVALEQSQVRPLMNVTLPPERGLATGDDARPTSIPDEDDRDDDDEVDFDDIDADDDGVDPPRRGEP